MKQENSSQFVSEFTRLQKKRVQKGDKSKGVQVHLKNTTIEKLEFLSFMGGMNKSQLINLIFDDPDIFESLTGALLKYVDDNKISEGKRFKSYNRTCNRQEQIAKNQVSNQKKELYSHLKDEDSFFQEYAFIRCWQEYSLGNSDLERWCEETNNLDKLLKTIVSLKGSKLINGSLMDFISSIEVKYEMSRDKMLKEEFLVTDEELATKYKYVNPLLGDSALFQINSKDSC